MYPGIPHPTSDFPPAPVQRAQVRLGLSRHLPLGRTEERVEGDRRAQGFERRGARRTDA